MNSALKTRIIQALFNPFERIAGGPSLLLGLLSIVLASWIGARKNIHFDGVLDMHVGPPFPLWLFIGEGIVSWLCMCVCLWIAGKAISRTSFRALDLCGTQALARWPTVITAIISLLPGFHRFTDQLVQAIQADPLSPQITFASSDALAFLAVTIVMLLGTVWMVALMWKSFSLCCNVRGTKAVLSFTVSLILAEVLSKVLIAQLPSLL